MADRSADRGFTLPELLITVLVVGLLTAAVATAFIVVLRSMPPAEARADDARTLTGLTTYLPEDVGSTPPDAFVLDDPDHLTGCAGESPGLGLLHLRWTNRSRSWNVDYRLDLDGESSRVLRYECEPGGPPEVSTLTSRLPDVDPETWRPGTAPVAVTSIWDARGRVVGVKVKVTTESGMTASMVARSNNPAETLDTVVTTTPATTTSTTSTSSTTSTTSTITTTSTPTTTITPPPEGETSTTTTTTASTTTTSTTTTLPPCVVTSLGADPPDATNNSGNSGKTMAKLREDVEVAVVAEGPCTNLVLEFDPDLSDGTYDPQWLTFEPVAARYLVTIDANPAGVQWSDGPHELVVRNGKGTPALAAIELEVS